MRDTGIYFWALPVARTVVGFILSTMLGIAGGWLVLIFNAMTGYPWAFGFHQNLYFVGIGAGAGVGAYIGWANFAVHPRYIVGTVLVVIVGGIVGAYLGLAYGEQAEPHLLGRRYTIENNLHLGAPIGAIIVSTAVGLVNEIRSGGR